MANDKGYKLVASNSVGNNIFFVRNDLLSNIETISVSQAYNQAEFREYHDESGNLTFDDFDSRLQKIKHLPVYDLKSNSIISIEEATNQD